MHNILHHCATRTSATSSLSASVIFLIIANYGRQQSDLPWSDAQVTQFDRRAFSVCGPDIWNNLTTNIRLIDSHAAFPRALKNRLSTTAFNS